MRKYLYEIILSIIYISLFILVLCHSSSAITSSIGTNSRTYSTIVGWEDAVNGVLTDIEKGECYDDGDFSEAVIIDGSTTTPSLYMHLTSASGHGWVDNGGTHLNGVVNDMGAIGSTAFLIDDNYFLLENMIIIDGGSGIEHVDIGGGTCTARNIISVDCPDHATDIAGSNNKLLNVITINSADDAIYFSSSSTGNYAGNCLAWNTTGNGFQITSSSAGEWENCISMGSSVTDFATSGSVTESYNISADTTAAGTGSLISRTGTTTASPGEGDWVIFENLTAGTEDFHLKDNVTDNDAQDAGVDTGGYALDIDLETRTGSWDIGPDEYVAAGGAVRRKMFISSLFDPLKWTNIKWLSSKD